MTETSGLITYRRLRAPREDGGTLFDPPVDDEAAFLQQNITLREQSDGDIRGRALRDLRAEARRSVLRQAYAYTSEYRDVSDVPLACSSSLILTGHQPELVHPGVWFKNFLLSELARRTASCAVNLLIDNDAVKSNCVRVPGGTLERPYVTAVPLDAPTHPLPYEARRIEDAEIFSSFAARVRDAIGSLVPDPLVNQFWPAAVAAGRQHRNLGRAVAQARHVIEGQWQLRTLELPLSAVCDDTPFRWFAAHLLAEAPRLRSLHNACLAEYRRVHKIRGVTHPVHDLMRLDGWTEVPFWIWTDAQPQRRAAFVRRHGARVLLTDRRDCELVLELPEDGDAAACVQQLEEARRAGLRLRPRALITTMFSRLVLSDIFIHGIGGAKYDQVTDALVRRFFGFEPPAFLVATATLKLPVPRTLVAPEDLRRVPHLLRELRYHPELYVERTAENRALIAEKRRWIDTDVPATGRRQRHQRIEAVNEELQRSLTDQRHRLLEEQHILRALMHKRAILDSREYAFCLFPAESLRRRLLDLSRQEP